ncbi:MAG: HAD family hydrolase [Nitrospirota bacterium]|nr:HAD family hydrolase [Nitrospirota bacterium]MDH4362037.1 HAD family hydrolase [Nitrospirota bacterium]MDH5295748.1 HAD family hydrolase [Nitrospirota bacterium]
MKGLSIRPGSAVFVDRDGTLNQDSGYVTSPDQLVLFPGVPQAIARLNQLGVLVLMVTNQSAIGRGMMTMEDLTNIHGRLAALIRPYGARIDGIFSCPHLPQDDCGCRKPKRGLIDQAVDRFSLDLSKCYLVGDKRSDLEVAQKVAVPGVLVMTSPYSKGALQARDEGQVAIEHVAETFAQAVDWIEQHLMKGVT